MKLSYLITGVLFSLLFNFSANAQQQSNKESLLFAQAPDRVNCNPAILDQVFRVKNSSRVTLNISEQLSLTGEVTEQIAVSNDTQIINIRCSNYNNALFTLTRIREANQPERFIGRIIHPKSNDAYVLVNENGGYQFKKQTLSQMMAQ